MAAAACAHSFSRVTAILVAVIMIMNVIWMYRLQGIYNMMCSGILEPTGVACGRGAEPPESIMISRRGIAPGPAIA